MLSYHHNTREKIWTWSEWKLLRKANLLRRKWKPHRSSKCNGLSFWDLHTKNR